jgi:hypothetical protein
MFTEKMEILLAAIKGLQDATQKVSEECFRYVDPSTTNNTLPTDRTETDLEVEVKVLKMRINNLERNVDIGFREFSKAIKNIKGEGKEKRKYTHKKPRRIK